MGFQLLRFAGKLAPGALKILGGTGAAVGVGAAGTATVLNTVPGAKETFGQTAEAQAEARVDAGKFNRENGVLKSGILEQGWDQVLGRTDVASKAQTYSNKKIEKANEEDLIRLTKRAQGLDIDIPTLGNNESAASYKAEVAEALGLVNRTQAVIADGGQVQGPITQASVGQAEATRPGSVSQLQKRADIERAEDLLREANRDRLSQDRYLAQLEATNTRNANQFAIQMAQQQYQNRQLDMRDARDSRKDKMAIIAQIMKGLEASGRAFTY